MAGFVFGKQWDETYQEYRDRSINSISPSFCGAKWYNATIWLNMGQTTSCHHPQPHKIPLRELERSPKALHNTQYKKLVRKEMGIAYPLNAPLEVNVGFGKTWDLAAH